MACPFFSPTERADDLALPHPIRLPLGAPWRGTCEAPGDASQLPNNQELEGCNLGYAKSCPRLPEQRSCDAVRLGATRHSGKSLLLAVITEKGHLPVAQSSVEYDYSLGNWISLHPEPRIQKMAECFLQSYLERQIR